MPHLLTAAELAEILHVSPAWVVNRVRRHELPGYKLGSSWRFDAQEIAVWLSGRGNAPTRQPSSVRGILPEAHRSPPRAPIRLETALEAGRVAAALDVPITAVQGWVKAGILPGVGAGRACVVDLDGFEQWQQILGDRVAHLPPGRLRTSSTRDAIESALLHRRDGGWALTPTSARRSGVRVPAWAEVFSSGRK